MAPEQVEGKRTDARSDQFSLGLVLFEMLAGERAYDGEDMRGVMLGILVQPPKDLAPRLPHDAPTQVLDVIDHMLRKDPSERFPDLEAALRSWQALPA
jgi:serine/threonine-protein kinase